jgi:hypothetical protein
MKTSQELLDELEAWCKERYGRKTNVAKLLGVTPQIVNDWFVKDVDKRSKPSWDTGLKIQQFLAMNDSARRAMIREKDPLTGLTHQTFDGEARRKALINHGK